MVRADDAIAVDPTLAERSTPMDAGVAQHMGCFASVPECHEVESEHLCPQRFCSEFIRGADGIPEVDIHPAEVYLPGINGTESSTQFFSARRPGLGMA
jgi:hypothetical protein